MSTTMAINKSYAILFPLAGIFGLIIFVEIKNPFPVLNMILAIGNLIDWNQQNHHIIIKNKLCIFARTQCKSYTYFS